LSIATAVFLLAGLTVSKTWNVNYYINNLNFGCNVPSSTYN